MCGDEENVYDVRFTEEECSVCFSMHGLAYSLGGVNTQRDTERTSQPKDGKQTNIAANKLSNNSFGDVLTLTVNANYLKT